MTAVARDATQVFDLELELSRRFLLATVREMVRWTARIAYSTCFAEGEDFTCGLFDPRGRLVVQAAGLPAQMGTLADGMAAVLRASEDFQPGDVFIHNDPFDGGSHQADVMITRPIFLEGELIAFAANKGHWFDIGGSSAGGWDGSVTHAIQEGLVLPAMKLMDGGAMVDQVARIIERNVRLPRYVWGDLQAQVASSAVAEARIHELGAAHGRARLEQSMEAAIEHSARRFRARLREFPAGEVVAEDVMEDDGRGGGPYPVRVAVRVDADGVRVSFAGTSPQVQAPINATLACTRAAAYGACIAVIDPDVPVSSGCLDLIEVDVPEGSLLNAVYPAPVFGGTADPGNRAAETVLRALSRLGGVEVTAGSYATGNNTVAFGSRPDGEEFLWYVFESGGCGARRDADGNSAEWHLMANCKNESMEVWETRYPLELDGYRLVPDSGGPGRKRGGLGTERRLRVLAPTTVSALADRHAVPPWGLDGGADGTCNAIRVVRDGRELRPTELGATSDSKFGGLRLEPGDVLVVRQGGGGGYGPPRERSFDEIDRDLRLGYVTAREVESGYDVAVAGSAVDRDATLARREGRAR